MSYTPKPIDTRGLELPLELHTLTERLAENAHDLWAAERLAQGWTYGPQRDDHKKLHPCLVPYSQLPDAERKFDRVTAIGTLKAILALGYSIVPAQHHG
jgi:ryanodine receptor 2